MVSLSLSEAWGCLLLVSPATLTPRCSRRFSGTLYTYLAFALLLLHLIFSTKPCRGFYCSFLTDKDLSSEEV